MKYLIIVPDGMADYPIPELGNKTPLEYAKTPNIDGLAKEAVIGLVKTIPEGFAPGSDVANLSVMGYDPSIYYTGRSPLEAISMGVKLEESDLTLRCNLVTLSDDENLEDKIMLDYSAGEISSGEAKELIGCLQKELGSREITFYPGISYRHVMVWKNASGLKLKLTPPHDISDRKIDSYLPEGDKANIILDLIQKSQKILKKHPVNKRRREKGLKEANSIWLWGEGRKPSLNSFQEKYNLNGSVVAAVDLVKGLGIAAGLRPVLVEGATGSIETNFKGKGEAAINELKKGQDFVYLHIESPDEASHQGSLEKKIWAIEQIDKEVIGLILSVINEFDDLKIMIMPDHPTPISLKTHTAEPVPFMIYDKNNPVSESIRTYNEKYARDGIYFSSGYELMDYFIKGDKK
ncbi:cofactor-independent phosphoglycerate mutase [Thermosyntropha sp.]|uniref:cofactor-independent phosphoglycerate mutase n=1 Tax=Thermosyntropha sp. TaxID=2740820 RepID=UPI0025DD2D65|nr:cofactor-independent phosphoglycerate mutase [Thermosyntropha sp.]MBO8159571.1 cofactor-independent phosphoglycerate mutase [Thermosyntropha sp.]